jgi:hypothetical protein
VVPGLWEDLPIGNPIRKVSACVAQGGTVVKIPRSIAKSLKDLAQINRGCGCCASPREDQVAQMKATRKVIAKAIDRACRRYKETDVYS